MTDPRRLNRSDGLAGALLSSAKADRAPPGASRRILASAAVTAALATKASSSAASVTSLAHAMARWAAWKWVAFAAVGAASAVTVDAIVSPRAPVAPPVAVARVSGNPAATSTRPRRPETSQPTTPWTVATSVLPDVAPSAAIAAPPTAPARPAASPAATNSSSRAAPSGAALEPPHTLQPSRLALVIAAIDDAKATLATGRAEDVLRKLDTYETAFPHGMLGAEAKALRIEALARAGRDEEARAQLVRFRAEHAGSPLLEGLVRVVGD